MGLDIAWSQYNGSPATYQNFSLFSSSPLLVMGNKSHLPHICPECRQWCPPLPPYPSVSQAPVDNPFSPPLTLLRSVRPGCGIQYQRSTRTLDSMWSSTRSAHNGPFYTILSYGTAILSTPIIKAIY